MPIALFFKNVMFHFIEMKGLFFGDLEMNK